MCNPDFARAREVALAYRKLGLVPLPSRMDDKRPTIDHGVFRTKPVPEGVYSETKWGTTNIQLMTGQATSGSTKIMVVDCDGQRAREVWSLMCKANGMPSSSIWVSSSPSGGRHFYFGVPEGRTIKTRVVWGIWDTWGPSGKGGWVKHAEVKILGEGSLVIAPPSVHVEHPGQRYAFEPGFSPREHRYPAVAPDWLVHMAPVQSPKAAVGMLAESGKIVPRKAFVSEASLDMIQDGISARDKEAIAVSWGLRLSARNGDGWVHCHCIGRDDERPSAGFHPATGRYHDHTTGETLSFFQLGVSLGAFDSPVNCAKWCAWRAIGSTLAGH